MVSLDKTPESILASQVQAIVNKGLRRNGLIALQWEFGNRIADAQDKAEAQR
ncbi:hypothetical protein KGG73_gp72 [Streptomyces phage Sentinel]|uniref:Uncharacterized protein n=1 Tax=Streptomyces phage Sentinel TaxID=2767584 RepID=A0A873WK80_9CAUD|nr:hypothetical protein KGG73_gp72 [Streptomyces phage Sentinel]QPB09906.1 hypothetical protein CPT_Sentinel_072 [Streptomyces phage Sentinel]